MYTQNVLAISILISTIFIIFYYILRRNKDLTRSILCSYCKDLALLVTLWTMSIALLIAIIYRILIRGSFLRIWSYPLL